MKAQSNGARAVARRPPLPVLLLIALVLAACGSPPAIAGGSASTDVLRLGYFPNLTHAPALVGLESGLYEQRLGSGVRVEARPFNAGTEAIEALLSGALDATYIGPNPAINAFFRSNGAAIRIIAGATSGGASFVVRDGIDAPGDLAGTNIATPSLGNTQDVALRTWLAEQGFATTPDGGGDVHITPQANAQTLEAFVAGTIDGAWVPEPWATRLILEGGGHVLVDERDLWPDGRFVTTHLIVATAYLDDHPDFVRALLQAHYAAVDVAATDPAEAKVLTNQGIEAVTGKPIAQETLDAAWSNLTFTVDPIASSLRGSADAAMAAGLLDPVDLNGIYELGLLNDVLAANGDPTVAGL